MSLEQLIFYVFSTLLIFSAFGVIAAKNPVHSVLFLVFSFFNSAVLWIMLNAEFLALILILVYVGAVMTLFLFVVMMLNLDQVSISRKYSHYFIPGFVVSLTMFAIMLFAFDKSVFIKTNYIVAPNAGSNTLALGEVLYTDYFLPFQIAAVILLTSIIAAITLTLRAPRRKQQSISAQLEANKKTSVELVNVDRDSKLEGEP